MMRRAGLLSLGVLLAAVYVTVASNAGMEVDITVGEPMPEIVLAAQDLAIGNDLKLNVRNPTGQDAVFRLTAIMSRNIPAGGERVVYLDITPVHDRRLPYRIVHPAGGVSGEGVIINQGSLEDAIASL